MAHSEFDSNRLAARAAPRQRGEIGRTVCDMHALEQAVAGKLLRRLAQELLRGLRHEKDAALLVMTRDHVGRVLCEQPVALFADADRIFRSPMDELHGDGETGGVDGRAHGAEQAEKIGRYREGRPLRHEAEFPAYRERDQTKGGKPRRPGDHAPVRRERCLQGNRDHPGNEEGGDAAGEPG